MGLGYLFIFPLFSLSLSLQHLVGSDRVTTVQQLKWKGLITIVGGLLDYLVDCFHILPALVGIAVQSMKNRQIRTNSPAAKWKYTFCDCFLQVVLPVFVLFDDLFSSKINEGVSKF